MSTWAEPSKGRHVFVVLRRDDHIDDPIESIVGTKAFGDLGQAEAEAARLNEVNGEKGARYFVVVARLQGGSSR
jgi:hypothetical protein